MAIDWMPSGLGPEASSVMTEVSDELTEHPEATTAVIDTRMPASKSSLKLANAGTSLFSKARLP